MEEGGKIIHKLPRSDLDEEVGAAVLDAGISEVEGAKLLVGIFGANPPLQRSHSIFGLNCSGADDVGYLEVQGNILQTAAGGLLNLFIQGAVGRGREPTTHHVERRQTKTEEG